MVYGPCRAEQVLLVTSWGPEQEGHLEMLVKHSLQEWPTWAQLPHFFSD